MLKSSSSTGVVVMVHWSARGDVKTRKQRWGQRIAKMNKEPLGPGAWHFPNGQLSDFQPLINDVISPSDKVVVVFPHGKNAKGASLMYIHTNA